MSETSISKGKAATITGPELQVISKTQQPSLAVKSEDGEIQTRAELLRGQDFSAATLKKMYEVIKAYDRLGPEARQNPIHKSTVEEFEYWAETQRQLQAPIITGGLAGAQSHPPQGGLSSSPGKPDTDRSGIGSSASFLAKGVQQSRPSRSNMKPQTKTKNQNKPKDLNPPKNSLAAGVGSLPGTRGKQRKGDARRKLTVEEIEERNRATMVNAAKLFRDLGIMPPPVVPQGPIGPPPGPDGPAVDPGVPAAGPDGPALDPPEVPDVVPGAGPPAPPPNPPGDGGGGGGGEGPPDGGAGHGGPPPDPPPDGDPEEDPRPDPVALIDDCIEFVKANVHGRLLRYEEVLSLVRRYYQLLNYAPADFVVIIRPVHMNRIYEAAQEAYDHYRRYLRTWPAYRDAKRRALAARGVTPGCLGGPWRLGWFLSKLIGWQAPPGEAPGRAEY
jgi:hypothetical protein